MSKNRRRITTARGDFDAVGTRPRRGRQQLAGFGQQSAEMLDREAIRQLPIAHARFARARDVEGMVGLYAKDAIIEVPTADPRVCIHGHHFEILERDRAEGSVYIEIRIGGRGFRASPFRCYRDHYVKEEGVWKFRSRQLCAIGLGLPDVCFA